MVTLSSADSVLKSYYLDAISETLNTKISPFLAKIERTTENVVGKEVRKTLRVGVNGGIGASTETGNLPVACPSQYTQIVAPLKNLYGTIEISDKAIRASANNDGAFVNLLKEEMDSLVHSARFHFNRMLFGTVNGDLGVVKRVEGNKIYVTDIQNFAVGMHVCSPNAGEEYEDFYIKSVDMEEGAITTSLYHIWDNELVGYPINLVGSADEELTGLRTLHGECMYGVTFEDMGLKPYQRKDFGDFTESKLLSAIDKVEAASGHRVDMIVCSWGVRRMIKNFYMQYNLPVKMVKVEGGFTAMDFMGIPVVVDRFCPEGTMYLLSTDCWKLCQLCDWQWLEAEDGKILKQVPGKPVYAATLVKYAELVCENPAAQGVISGIYVEEAE